MGKSSDKGISLRRCEIVTNLEIDGKEWVAYKVLNDILNQRKCIDEYSYIVHDKDVYTKEDEQKNPKHIAGTLKPNHIHLLLKFTAPQRSYYIGKWFGLKENFVSKINGKWEDAVLYQIHYNAPEKYPYDVSEVTANFDVKKIIESKEKNQKLCQILERIDNGEIREYNKTQEIDHIMLIKQSRLINEAFKVRQEHLLATMEERNMECIYITGESQVGKTTFAKRIAREKGLSYFVSSSSNDILDGYAQQPVIIVDDIRPSVMGFSDLLKMLDNHTMSTVKSRYKNKLVNCELIILTSILDIDNFYKNVFKDDDEPIIQLKRRCSTHIRMDKERIYISKWDKKELRYTHEIEYVNDILKEYIPEHSLNYEEVSQEIEELIPFLKKPTEKEKKDGFIDEDNLEIPF